MIGFVCLPSCAVMLVLIRLPSTPTWRELTQLSGAANDFRVEPKHLAVGTIKSEWL